MAKKRKRNSKLNKNQRCHRSVDVVVHSDTWGSAAIPDPAYRVKRKPKKGNDCFVNVSCINGNSLLQLASVGTVPKLDTQPLIIKSKRRGVVCAAAFVPESCITNATTPVIHICLNKQKETSEEEQGKRPSQKIRINKLTAFVPKSCITDQISIPYVSNGVKKTTTNYPLPVALTKPFDIVFEARTKRRKKSNLGEFIPDSCITTSTTPSYQPETSVKAEKYFNPYPALPDLAPSIVGGNTRRLRSKHSGSGKFVPTSCITKNIAKVASPTAQAIREPAIKYLYADRPNSPDIHGPKIKRTKKKKTNLVAFVPKSCTIEEKITERMIREVKKEDALARTAPESAAQVESTLRLPLILFVIVLMGFIYYLFRN